MSTTPLSRLRRYAAPAPAPPPRPAPPEVCELCAEPVAEVHGHVADLRERRLLCTCRPCTLLFAGPGAGGRRYRAVPTQVRRVDGFALNGAQWDALQIPVGLAFLFRQSPTEEPADAGPERTTAQAAGFTACYPGPAGATESLLDLSSWADVLEANPALCEVEADVEAVLLRRVGDTFQCYVTPIDACYELVGLVRRRWVGLSGGTEVWADIGAFFERLERGSVRVPAAPPASGRERADG